MVGLRAGYVSITGNYRDNNEDNLFVDPHLRFFLVADGMGGQAAGEKASQLAVELISQRLTTLIAFKDDPAEKVVASVDAAVDYANHEIIALGQVDPALHQMGTTVAFLVRVGDSAYVGGVGDSRVYRLTSGELEQLTKDHSLTQALRDAGTISDEEARTHRYKNVLYRYLGTRDGSKGTGARPLPLNAGDRYLICSDGVTDGIGAAKIRELLAAGGDPQSAAERIVAAAQEGGSRDNITAVVLFVDAKA